VTGPLRIEALEGRRLLSTSSYTFDFGTTTSPVLSGAIGVSTETYTPTRGYGWVSASDLGPRDRGQAPGYLQVSPTQFRDELSSLARDFVQGSSSRTSTFLVDLPNGGYAVTAVMGDYSAPHDMMAISAEGKTAVSGLTTDAAGQFIRTSFQVQVSDGQLTLGLSDLGGKNPYWALNGLEIRSLDAPPPALAAQAGGPYRTPENTPVTLSATATGGSSLAGNTFAWDLDGNGTFEASGRQVSTTFADNGTYAVSVRVTDSTGQTAVNTATVQVDNVAPTVTYGGPAKSMAGEAVTLQARASDPSPVDVAAGLAFQWDFGDGTTGSGASPSHKYAKAGTYTVTVTAADKDGAKGSTQAKIVVDPPAGGMEMGMGLPDYGENPTIVSAGSGPWSDPATWSQRRVPGPGDVVAISEGTSVVYDVRSRASLDTVVIDDGGTLRFRTDVDTEMLVGTMMVMPGGTLEVGTQARPVSPGVRATITIADRPIDTMFDPEQFGHGLVGLGNVTIHGAPMNSTFVRLAAEPRAGDTKLVLSEPVSGWRAGDWLFLPDTRQLVTDGRLRSSGGGYYSPQAENPTIASISADGRTLTLASPLRFDHLGARNGDGTLEFLPHVADLSRNVEIRSENPEGTRGYTMFMGEADVDIRYAWFRDLGRTTNDPLDNTTFDRDGMVSHVGTNQIGRYPLHLHYLNGPSTSPDNGYQFTLIGNSVDNTSPDDNIKWGLTIHASHYGLARDNVVHNWAGAGLVMEDGSESYNVIEHNFVGRIHGVGGRGDVSIGGWGRQGHGIWLGGTNNYVRDNVVANVFGTTNGQSYGYTIIPAGDQFRYLPTAPGESPSEKVNIHDLPILEFARNEFYGTASTALTFWYIGSYSGTGSNLSDIIPESVIKDFRAWHFYDQGVYVYPSKHVSLDGYVARGDQALLAAGLTNTKGYFAGDYKNVGMIIRNANIQGLKIGVTFPTLSNGEDMTVQDSYLRNYTNVVVATPFNTGSLDAITPRRIIIRNVAFATPNIRPIGGVPMQDIEMQFLSGGNRTLIQKDQVYVYDYNQVKGDNFQVYYREQHADFVVPQTSSGPGGTIIGAPEAGLTNRQVWQKYGVAIAGAVAPTTANERVRIKGLVNRT
jgi:chitodextrinase